jgi:hypothetical protein
MYNRAQLCALGRHLLGRCLPATDLVLCPFGRAQINRVIIRHGTVGLDPDCRFGSELHISRDCRDFGADYPSPLVEYGL